MKEESPDKRWAKILAEYLDRFKIKLPKFPLALDVGCGNAAVWNYLGLVHYLQSRDLGVPHYVAVDKDEKAFQRAKAQLGDLITFLACDARQLDQHIHGRFSLAVSTHPELTTSPEGPRIWREIFSQIAGLLAPRGCLIVTSFWLQDHIPAQVAVGQAGFQILYSGTNRYPGKRFDTASNGEQLQYDKYILIGRRRL